MTGSDPAGQPPWAHPATASAHGGFSSLSVDARWGPRSAGSPSGILLAVPHAVGRLAQIGYRDGTTQEGVTGFDFGS